MCFIRILLVSSLTLLINACSTYNDFFGKIEAETKFQPIGGKPIEVLQGSGTVIYVCVSDDKGTFYKFENMNVELFSKFKLLQAEISGPNQRWKVFYLWNGENQRVETVTYPFRMSFLAFPMLLRLKGQKYQGWIMLLDTERKAVSRAFLAERIKLVKSSKFLSARITFYGSRLWTYS